MESVSELDMSTTFSDVPHLSRSEIDLSPPPRIAEKKRSPVLLQQMLQEGLVARELRVGEEFVGRVARPAE